MAIRWYVLHVFSGSEKKVAQLITEQAESNELTHQIEDVMVPTEEVVEVRRGARVQSERKFFPGYILVKMELTDEAWQLVTSQPRVTGFLGGKGKPVPITNAEAEASDERRRRAPPAPLSHSTLASRCAFQMDRLHPLTVLSKRLMMTRRA